MTSRGTFLSVNDGIYILSVGKVEELRQDNRRHSHYYYLQKKLFNLFHTAQSGAPDGIRTRVDAVLETAAIDLLATSAYGIIHQLSS